MVHDDVSWVEVHGNQSDVRRLPCDLCDVYEETVMVSPGTDGEHATARSNTSVTGKQKSCDLNRAQQRGQCQLAFRGPAA